MSDTNERSVGSDGSVVAWAVVCGDCVDSMFTDRDKAVEWACRLIPPRQIVPLYRAPTLTDAEREFLQNLRDAYEELANQTGSVNAAAQADSRKNAATLRGLLERLG